MKLTPASFKTGAKFKRAAKAHSGYVDQNGQTYLPPANPKKLEWLKAKMRKAGHEL